jgi:hypothetical protein
MDVAAGTQATPQSVLALPRYIGAFRNKTDGGGYVAQLITRDPAELEQFARRHDVPGKSVYDCVNPLLPDATSRDKESVAEQDTICADIDCKDLLTPRDEVLKALLGLPLPFEIRDSGGGGFHPVLRLKEGDARETKMFERINDTRSRLIHVLCADTSQDHHAHLLRRVGTWNTNYDPPGRCRVIREGKAVDITEVEKFLELHPAPLFEKRPEAKQAHSLNGQGLNGGTPKHPFDLEEWSAELYYPGNIHIFKRQGTASLISSGTELICAVDTIDAAVLAYTERCPPTKPWNWDRERRRTERMSYSWINKHPDLAPMLPNRLYVEF